MYHLSAFFGSVANGASFAQVNALNDQILMIQNNAFLLPNDMKLLGAYVMATDLLNARLRSPKIDQYNPYSIRPIENVAVPPTDPLIMDIADRPLDLRQMEELRLEASHSNAGAQNVTGLIWLADQVTTPPPGEVYKVRFTSSGTATVNVWTSIAITLGQNLPDGEYAMVYSELAGASGQAHRWTFSNQYSRPGMLCVTAETNRTYMGFYKPRFGVMGTFNTYNIPRLEVLANAATASWVGYFACIKIR